jgi:hypothetical protein
MSGVMMVTKPWWWLTCQDENLPDDKKFVGAVIIQGVNVDDAHENAREKGFCIGYKVVGFPIPKGMLPKPRVRNRLIPKAQANAMWDSVKCKTKPKQDSCEHVWNGGMVPLSWDGGMIEIGMDDEPMALTCSACGAMQTDLEVLGAVHQTTIEYIRDHGARSLASRTSRSRSSAGARTGLHAGYPGGELLKIETPRDWC